MEGLETDGELIRTLAHRLAEGGLPQSFAGSHESVGCRWRAFQGRILTALRRSPLVDTELQISREHLADEIGGLLNRHVVPDAQHCPVASL